MKFNENPSGWSQGGWTDGERELTKLMVAYFTFPIVPNRLEEVIVV
jgi:hypothetical protein